jgi:uncharacterized protein (TIGR02284 family)
MDNQKAIDVLNKLAEINNDRIEGYETASKEAEEADLINLFSQLSVTSQKCKAELSSEVIKLGGKPEEGTKMSGKFFRAWMDVKAAITGKDRKSILNSCEFGEDEAVKTYEDVLENDVDKLSLEHKMLVEKQYGFIKADHDRIKKLRDSIELIDK